MKSVASTLQNKDSVCICPVNGKCEEASLKEVCDTGECYSMDVDDKVKSYIEALQKEGLYAEADSVLYNAVLRKCNVDLGIDADTDNNISGCTADYLDYVSVNCLNHLSYNDLMYPDPDECGTGPCSVPDLYKTGRLNTDERLRAMQGLDNQSLANVCICGPASFNACNSTNMYPLRNAEWCKIGVDQIPGCQTSFFNTKV